jgi:putative FmdB family regulatory protein
MPLYEYQCPVCGRFEIIQKFSDARLTVCPTCGRKVERLLSAPAIQFKGTGWYVTDYAKKSSGGGEAGESKGSGASSSSAKESGSKESGTKEKSASDKGGSKETPAKGSGSSK